MIGPAGIALGTATVARRWTVREPVVIGTAALVTALAPVVAGATALLLLAMLRFARAARRTRHRRAVDEAALEVAELVGLGLAGGLSVAASHRVALEHCLGAVEPELRGLVEAIDRLGVVPALEADTGPTAAVSSVLVTATASGAPVLPALESHIRHEQHRRHTEAVESARRLPIRLLVPLTLLVLPGFVLITVGPAVVDSLARLSP